MNFNWIFSRLSEGSTWAGLPAIVGGAFGFTVSPDLWTHVVAAVTAICGLAAFLIPDKAHKP